jgi:predicted ATPase with chaperone activity
MVRPDKPWKIITAVRPRQARPRACRRNNRTRLSRGNLGPAELQKDAGAFDLPIALALLVATDQLVPERLGSVEQIGFPAHNRLTKEAMIQKAR